LLPIAQQNRLGASNTQSARLLLASKGASLSGMATDLYTRGQPGEADKRGESLVRLCERDEWACAFVHAV
jgi:hypothetical protein